MKTKSKKCLVCLLSVVLMFAYLSTTSFAESEVDVDDNVWIQVPYLTDKSKFTGSGTEIDPYYAESFYNRGSLDQIEIVTVNPQAQINDGGNSLTVYLNYGYNDIRFSVTSADKTVTAYYWVKWQRTKSTRPNGSISSGTLYSVPATDGQDDGKICGLDANEYYDYKLNGAAEWSHIHGVTEITGLSAGTYKVKYGESESMQASSDSLAVSVIVGESSQTMQIQNNTNYTFVDLPQSAAVGQRVDLKLALQEDEWVKKIDAKNSYAPPSGWGSSSAITFYFDGYTVENDTKYYNAHFLMPTTYQEYRSVQINSVTLSTEKYYNIELPEENYLITKVTPQSSDDVLTVDGQTVYKDNSTVTIAIEINSSFGTRVLKSFKIIDDAENVVGESTDGTPVSVLVTQNLKISDVVTETIYADFTEMEKQLARLEGVELFNYTDNTRVVVEERLALAKNMYTVTQKDQYLVDDFVPTLKAAIDALEPKAGDFSTILQLMDKIPQNLSDYLDDTVKALEQAKKDAQQAVDENWNRLRQDEIDDLAIKLKDSIEALKYKDADYSKVDEAIAKADALNKNDYKDFSPVEAAVNAVVRGKNITEQAEVDAMAQAIENALEALVKNTVEPAAPSKPTTPSTPTNQSKTHTNTGSNSPQTGDNSHIALWIVLLLLTGGGLTGTVLYCRKRSVR